MPKRSYDELLDAVVSLNIANRLAIQLLVLTLEEEGAIDAEDYADRIRAYLASSLADDEGTNAFLTDILDGMIRDDG